MNPGHRNDGVRFQDLRPFDADFLDHITRLRVKMLNDLFDFEQQLTVDEVEDELREARNIDFMEGKAVHVFAEITAILDYVPVGWESEEEGERPARKEDELDDQDLPALDEAEEERLKNDQSLKWDEDEEEDEDAEPGEEGEKKDAEDADEKDGEEKETAEDKDKGEPPRRRSSRAKE